MVTYSLIAIIPGVLLCAVRADLTAATGPADSLLSLESYISQVVERNPALKAARARERSARARVPQAGAWDNPQAGVEFYATPVTSVNPLRDGMETDYFLQQMIPFPGKKGAMSDAAEAGARLAGQAVVTAERNLVAEATRIYAMLYSAQRRTAVNEDHQSLLAQIIASARAKYGAGTGSQADVLKVQVELAKLQNERAALDQEAASSLAMLNALRSAQPGTLPERLGDIVPVPPPASLDSLLRVGREQRSELQEMQYEVAMNRSELTAAQREWLPDLMIKGTYKQMADQTDQWAAMVGISIPVAPWAIGNYSGGVGEREAELAASEESFRDMENTVASEIRDAYARADARWQQLGRYRTTILPQAEQALEASLAAYRSDNIDFLSLLDAYRMLQMYRMEYSMTLGEYLANRAELERAVGTDLD